MKQNKSTSKIKQIESNTKNLEISVKSTCNQNNVLFVGNGFARCYLDGTSWVNLLSEIIPSDKKDVLLQYVNDSKLSMTMLAQIGICMKLKEQQNKGKTAEEIISDAVSKAVSKKEGIDDNIEKLADFVNILNPKAIITTNYTFEVEHSICKNFKLPIVSERGIKNGSARKKTSLMKYTVNLRNHLKKQILHTYFTFKNIKNGKEDLHLPSVWHIHGHIFRDETMVLDHQKYGKVISYIKEYEEIFIARVIKFFNQAKDKDIYRPISWFDYFVFGNVFIVGHRMSQSEFDLWWLITARAGVIKALQSMGIDYEFGKITYYDIEENDEDKELKKIACDAFDIQYHNFYTPNSKEIYKSAYEDILEKLKKVSLNLTLSSKF